ncbi:uncharacterized protein EV422DRAFT_315903 [Fimicolochytrium jonesii]|uniref:uncharacterized protein n=1 Tax=Fimicolochytrium jonesii TaxID=1396493 RepID=UPI0022FE6E03|nr:uncharacterized protein EV422DRAFT_315903 [Fimicolochytrium jonesii]KAI8824310.1 hypothetical protein EV422DRAFT_315903 [Fimicolochytrium jonesii]
MQMGGGGMQTMQAASYGISVATSNAPQIMAQVQAAQMARSMPPGSMQHLAAGGVPMRPGGSVSQAQAQLLMAQQQQQQAGGRPVLQQQGLLTSVGQQQQQRPLLQQGTIDPHQYALSQIGPDITPQEGMMIANMTLASLKEHLEKNKLPMNSAQRAWNAKVTYDRAFAVAQESNARRAGQNIPQVPQQQPFQLRAPASMAQATPAVSQPFGTDPAQAQMLQPAAGVVARPRPPVAPEPVKTAVQQPARPAQPVPTAAGVIKRPVLTLDEGEQQYVRGKLESMKPMMQKAELMIGVLDSSTIPSDREAAKDCLQLMKVWQAQMELLPQNVFNFNPTSVEKLYNKMLHYTRTAEDRRRQMQQNGGVKTTRGSSQDPILVASPHSSVGGRPSGSYQFPASTQPEDASQVAPTIITESPEVAAVAIPTTKGGKKGKGKAAPNKKASATPTTATAATAAAPAAPPKSRGKRGSKSKAGTQDEPPLMSPDPAAGQPPATAAASPTLLAPKPKRSRGKSLATDAPAEQPATATSTAAAAAAAAKPNPTNAKTKAGAKTGAKAKQPATKTGSKSNAAPAGESAKPPSVLEAAALTASAGGVGGFSTTTAAAAQPQTATPTTAPITTVRTPSTKPDVDPHIQKAIENTYMNDFASFNTHPADPMMRLVELG